MLAAKLEWMCSKFQPGWTKAELEKDWATGTFQAVMDKLEVLAKPYVSLKDLKLEERSKAAALMSSALAVICGVLSWVMSEIVMAHNPAVKFEELDQYSLKKYQELEALAVARDIPMDLIGPHRLLAQPRPYSK